MEFADLFTDRTLARLAVDNLRFGRKISGSETISGAVPISSARVASAVSELAADRTAVYVYDDRDVVCGGLLNSPPEESRGSRGGETWSFSAATWEDYLDQVVISTDLDTLTSVDQLDIARTLVSHMQEDPHANIGIEMGAEMSGTLRDRTEYLASANKSYGEALSELGLVQGGFEWTIDTYLDPATGGRHRYLRLGTPTIGQSVSAHLLSGDDIQSWSLPAVSVAGTRFRARGGTPQGTGGTEQQPLLSEVYEATALLDAGYPRIDVVTDYSTISEQDTLEERAQADMVRGLMPPRVPKVSINLQRNSISPLALGDTVRIRIPRLYGPIHDARYRMTGIVVTAGGRSSEDTAELTLEVA
ncbi:hypothetical protein [Embleya sp. NPDC001921]